MPEQPEWLSGLNPQQLQAVTHGDGPLLIIAGAGTGKTNTLAHRVAWLIHQGVQPGRILLLTFTRRAAQEMLNRAQSAISYRLSASGPGSEAGGRQPSAESGRLSAVWGGTFHSMANRLLRTYGRVVGLQPDFTVMDESDSADMLGLIRAQMGLSSKEKRFPRKTTIRAIYSRVVNSREPLEAVLKKEYPWCVEAEAGLRAIFNTYTKRKGKRQVLDYDDLLLFWDHALGDATVADAMSARFDHILVDEYQDTNIIQAEILQRLRQNNHNITVVGDDAQSIYSFRAATIKNILDFPDQFPGTTVVTLEENYRSIQPILDVGNAVMKPAPHRYTKNLTAVREGKQKPMLITCRDEDEQVKVVCDQILEHLEQGIKLQQQAVLFRAGHHSDQLEIELARRNIPFHKYGGLKFLEAAHVKDLLALLRILENPRDDMSWFRVLEMFEGVGPRTAERFVSDLEARTFDLAVLGQITMPAAAHDQYQALAQTLLALRREELPVASQVERLRRFYEPLLATLYDNPKPRLRDLEQLEAVAQRYKSRSNFISDLTLDPPNSTADLAGPPYKDEDWLVLSTMHSAKGCEWKVVYVIHAADGMIPSDMATDDDDSVEEERRLFYVAVTRAKDWLYVVFPLRYYYKRYPLGDAHAYAQLTRFAPATVQKLMDTRMDMTELSHNSDRVPSHSGPMTDEEIRAKIAKYWDRRF